MDQIRLWWPNGYGDQPLYPLNVTFVSSNNDGDSDILIKNVGFRDLKIITEPVANDVINSSFSPFSYSSSSKKKFNLYFQKKKRLDYLFMFESMELISLLKVLIGSPLIVLKIEFQKTL